jgi:hypothetical protein
MRRLQSWIAILVLLGAAVGAGAQTPARAPAQSAPPQTWIPHEVTGVVKSIDNNGTQFTIQTRTGQVIQIDATAAIEARRANISAVGGAVKVQGAFDANGVLKASAIQREKDTAAQWVADR